MLYEVGDFAEGLRMVKGCAWTFAAVAVGLLTGVWLTPYVAAGPYHRNATRYAEAYAAERHRLAGAVVRCSGRRSNGNYVMCEVAAMGGTEVIECPANWLSEPTTACHPAAREAR